MIEFVGYKIVFVVLRFVILILYNDFWIVVLNELFWIEVCKLLKDVYKVM